MQRKYLLIATAVSEAGVGLLLLASPSLPQMLILGVDLVSPEASFFARLGGAALLAFALACWSGAADQHSVQPGLLLGVLTYDVAAAVILACTGWFGGLAGLLLWPAVVFHTVLAIWCVICLAKGQAAGRKNRAP
jgi:hypothetical protein